MEFILTSIATCLFGLYMTKRWIHWLEINRNGKSWQTIAFWLVLLLIPIIAIASRFNVFEIAALLHHIPRSGFLQSAIVAEVILALSSLVALEYNIYRIKNNSNSYEQVN